MTTDDGGLAGHGDLFKEPEGYFQPDKPATYAEHTLRSGQKLKLRLVGHNPLWVRRAFHSLMRPEMGALTARRVIFYGMRAG